MFCYQWHFIDPKHFKKLKKKKKKTTAGVFSRTPQMNMNAWTTVSVIRQSVCPGLRLARACPHRCAVLHNCCTFTHINANIFSQKRKCMRICAISFIQRKTDATRENVAKWQHAKFEKHPAKSEHNKKNKTKQKIQLKIKQLKNPFNLSFKSSYGKTANVWTVPALGFRRNLHGSQLIAMTTNYCWVQPMDAGPAPYSAYDA